MFNPPESFHGSGSYKGLFERMTRRVRENQIDAQIIEILTQTFEKELAEVDVMLSRPERVRLFRQVSQVILDEVAAKINGEK